MAGSPIHERQGSRKQFSHRWKLAAFRISVLIVVAVQASGLPSAWLPHLPDDQPRLSNPESSSQIERPGVQQLAAKPPALHSERPATSRLEQLVAVLDRPSEALGPGWTYVGSTELSVSPDQSATSTTIVGPAGQQLGITVYDAGDRADRVIDQYSAALKYFDASIADKLTERELPAALAQVLPECVDGKFADTYRVTPGSVIYEAAGLCFVGPTGLSVVRYRGVFEDESQGPSQLAAVLSGTATAEPAATTAPPTPTNLALELARTRATATAAAVEASQTVTALTAVVYETSLDLATAEAFATREALRRAQMTATAAASPTTVRHDLPVSDRSPVEISLAEAGMAPAETDAIPAEATVAAYATARALDRDELATLAAGATAVAATATASNLQSERDLASAQATNEAVAATAEALQVERSGLHSDSLSPVARTATLEIDPRGLLDRNPRARDEAIEALRGIMSQYPLPECRVGVVLISAKAFNLDDGEKVAQRISELLFEEFPDQFVPGRAVVQPRWSGNAEPYGQIGIELFLFEGCTPVVAVPDLVGRTESDAAAVAAVKGLVIEVGVPVVGATIAKGRVAFQDPAAGGTLPAGGTLQVHLSAGSDQVDPSGMSLTGLPVADAEQLLSDAGVNSVREEVSSRTVPEGIVLAIEPDTTIYRGDTVTLQVSAGDKVRIPVDIQGRPLQRAVQRLEAAGVEVARQIPVSRTTIESYGIDLESSGIVDQDVVGVQGGGAEFGGWVDRGTSIDVVYFDGRADGPATAPVLDRGTSAAVDLLPSVSEVPDGLVLAASGVRSRNDVILSLSGNDQTVSAEADRLLTNWGWYGNAYRDFGPATRPGTPSGILVLNVGIHGFADDLSADEAMTYFSDRLAIAKGLDDVPVEPLGDAVRALAGGPGDAPVAVLYVRDGNVVYRFGGVMDSRSVEALLPMLIDTAQSMLGRLAPQSRAG